MCQSSPSVCFQKIFAIQGDLTRLEIRADRSLMEFNKGKSKVLPLGRSNPSTRWGLGHLRSSFGDEQLRVLVEHRLIRVQQCALGVKKATPSWAALARIQPSCLVKLIFLLQSPLVTPIWWTMNSWALLWKTGMETLVWVQWRGTHWMESV